MGVVAPMTCGLGGDLFAIVYDAKTGTPHVLNIYIDIFTD